MIIEKVKDKPYQIKITGDGNELFDIIKYGGTNRELFGLAYWNSADRVYCNAYVLSFLPKTKLIKEDNHIIAKLQKLMEYG